MLWIFGCHDKFIENCFILDESMVILCRSDYIRYCL